MELDGDLQATVLPHSCLFFLLIYPFVLEAAQHSCFQARYQCKLLLINSSQLSELRISLRIAIIFPSLQAQTRGHRSVIHFF